MASFNNYHSVSNQAETQIVHGNIIYGLQDFDKAKDDQCLCDLRLTNPRDDKQRIEDTKDKLLQESFVWILDDADFKDWRDNQHTRLLWIKGDPGKGKTMLMIGLIDELSKQLESRPESEILAYFFCQGTDDRLRSAASVLRGLIYLLATKKRSLVRHIRKPYDVSGKLLFEDGNTWYALSAILSEMLDDSSLARVYLMVDALDECDSNLFRLLDLIADSSSRSSKVKWLVSSRNKLDIEERLRMANSPAKISLELNSYHISRAVNAFISSRVAKLANLKGYKEDLCEKIRKHLAAKADGTFLWVALVCKTLETTRAGKTLSVLEEFPSGLQSLYTRMLQQMSKIEDKKDLESCRHILSSLRLTYRPIHLKELASVTGVNENPNDLETLLILVGFCGSFLTIREETVYFVHQTAKDFLATSQSSHVLPLVQEEEHCGILARSLEAMSGTLRKDICNLRMPGVLLEELKDLDLGPLIRVRYACSYWVDHLCQASKLPQHKTGLYDNGPIHAFLKKHFLHWLEALSLMGMMCEGVIMVRKLITLLRFIEAGVDSLVAITQDAKRFILYHRSIIETAPLQVYASALVFSPQKSLVKRLFWSQGPNWIESYPEVGDIWSPLVQTLEVHDDEIFPLDGVIFPPNGVIFSPNGQLLASASNDKTSNDKTIRIWDAETGALQHTLKVYVKRPLNVKRSLNMVFSPDGQQLAASEYKTIGLWDVETGVLQQNLEGHEGDICAVAFSPTGQWLISVSDDRVFRRWHAETGAFQQILEGEGDSFSAVIFSPNGQWIVCASIDAIRLWDAETGVLQRTLKGHRDFVSSIALSPNYQWLASVSSNGKIRLWDVETGALKHIPEADRGFVDQVIFSPNGQWLAFTPDSWTIRLWNLKTEALHELVKDGLCPVAFSPNNRWLSSPSGGKSVRLWDLEKGTMHQTLEGHTDDVNAVAFSPNSQWLASASADDTIRLWDLEVGIPQQTLEGHKEEFNYMTFSPNGQILASASMDLIMLWDAETGAQQHTLEGRVRPGASMTFSPNSKCFAAVALIRSDIDVRLWDTDTGDLWCILDVSRPDLGVITFSPNGLWLAFASYETIDLYDTETGHLQQRLNVSSSPISAVTFSPNGQYLASASDGTIWLWDAETIDLEQNVEAKGKSDRAGGLAPPPNLSNIRRHKIGSTKRRIYESHIDYIPALAFSPNGQRIAFNSIWEIRLCDIKRAALQQTLKADPIIDGAIQFSLDGRHLITKEGFIELPTSYSNSTQPIHYGWHYQAGTSHWIMWKNHRVLWLPREYRPRCQAFHENAFAIGRSSGQVTIIRFKKNVSPIP